ncbi:MAG: hypothetical protein LBV56_24665 [Delftia acidovorans]|nr:hypothetical protein [Delftia acidovorans]
MAIGLALTGLLEQIRVERLVQRIRRGLPVFGGQRLILGPRQSIPVLLLALGPHHLVDGSAIGCNVWQTNGLCASRRRLG